jgi:hypothetical protein
VVFSTIRSITTIKSGKTVASLISGGYFAFYNIMLVYTVSDFPMWEKCLITFVCNVIGVYVVKLVEEKTTKDKLWKVELTVRVERTNVLARQLEELEIPYNYIPNVGKWTIFNVYCATQKESAFVKEIAIRNKAKFFAGEAKQL